jgi:PAS domain S-box-containing protein
MTGFPGIGDRIAQRMRVMGFWKDDRPDVARFCRERRYRRQYVYAWLQDRMPGVDNLRRLARDLDVTVAWLAVGEDSGQLVVAAAGNGHRARHARGADERRRRARTYTATGPPRAPGIELLALREATDRVVQLQADLEATLAAFPDPCIWIDEHGSILGVHGDGIPRGFSRARIVAEALPGNAAAALLAGVERATRTMKPVSVEYTLPTTPEPRTFEARILPVKTTRRPPKALVVLRDVTERARSEREYRELVHGSANGLCVHRDSIVLFVNGAFARMLGYASPADIVGRRIDAIAASDDRARRVPAVPVRRLQVECLRKDGTRFPTTALISTVSWQGQPATLEMLLPRGHQLSLA